MEIWVLFTVAIGLSMDAFAAAICKGLSNTGRKNTRALLTGLFFGGFQALMPIAGYLLGIQFAGFITGLDHWIAFVLLSVIGGKMLLESRDTCPLPDETFCLKNLTVVAVATSIDALAVGITFAFLGVNIMQAAVIIGATTMILSFIGFRIGGLLGSACKARADLIGGVILIFIGFKILLEHLHILA